ncbi:MAG: tetratricopeptide repeat protein [Caldilineaceae bacterium]
MIKILFLAANPTDTVRLRADEESRAIDEALRKSEFRDKFQIEKHFAVRVEDLDDLLLRHQPDIVHFCGHGSNTGEIIFQNANGHAEVASIDALSNLFKVLKDNIRCVVLNACYSKPQAQAIAEHIDCVVGISDTITDTASIRFAKSFYLGMGYGRSIQTSFELAKIATVGLGEQDIPQLLATKSNPSEVVLVRGEKPHAPPQDKVPKHIILLILAFLLIVVIAILFIATYIPSISGALTATPTPLPAPTDVQMQDGKFNIAVAIATSTDEGSKEVSLNLAKWFYSTISLEIDNNQLGVPTAVLEPKLVGKIDGLTSSDRAQQAADLAARIGAHMVIYGVLVSDGSQWKLLPEFFIADKGFFRAQEIIGEHALGMSIDIRGQGDLGDLIAVSDELSSRVQILLHIIKGLAHYAYGQYPKADEAFKDALTLSPDQKSSGQEVVYLLLGNTALKEEKFKEAESNYLLSLAIDPEYARSYIGLANANYRLALKPIDISEDPHDLDVKLINEALIALEKAENAKRKPTYADVQTKIHFERGQLYFALTWSGQDSTYENALDEFYQVINDFGDGQNPRVQDFAAEAHARIGLILDLTDRLEQAIKEYEIAVTLLASDRERRQQYEKRIASLRERIMSDTEWESQ